MTVSAQINAARVVAGGGRKRRSKKKRRNRTKRRTKRTRTNWDTDEDEKAADEVDESSTEINICSIANGFTDNKDVGGYVQRTTTVFCGYLHGQQCMQF